MKSEATLIRKELIMRDVDARKYLSGLFSSYETNLAYQYYFAIKSESMNNLEVGDTISIDAVSWEKDLYPAEKDVRAYSCANKIKSGSYIYVFECVNGYYVNSIVDSARTLGSQLQDIIRQNKRFLSSGMNLVFRREDLVDIVDNYYWKCAMDKCRKFYIRKFSIIQGDYKNLLKMLGYFDRIARLNKEKPSGANIQKYVKALNTFKEQSKKMRERRDECLDDFRYALAGMYTLAIEARVDPNDDLRWEYKK